MFLVKVTRNRGRGSKWVCPLGAVRVAFIFLTFMPLKRNSSRLLENIFRWRVWGKVTDYYLYRLFGIW
jgi:hypothetical protein